MSLPPHAPVVPASDTPAPPVRWGLLGAGHAARKGAQGIADADGCELVAVAARDPRRAQALADEVGCRTVDSYDRLCADETVEAVYIATTHPWHHEQALMAIACGKHVLVEKAFTLNAAQATEVFDAARASGMFAMEAMWTRTLPLIREIEQLVADGRIGDVVKVDTTLTLALDYDPQHRVFDIDNGGGALLDMGAYAATLPWLFLGRPDTVHVMGSLAPSGVDHVAAMQWGYQSGATAHVFVTSWGFGPGRAVIIGTGGYVEIDPSFHGATNATLAVPGQEPERLERPHQRFAHEFAEAARCIRAGEVESPLVPHADTIGILEVLDAARSELGVRYPQEPAVRTAPDGGPGVPADP